jgi:hypothetical protein
MYTTVAFKGHFLSSISLASLRMPFSRATIQGHLPSSPTCSIPILASQAPQNIGPQVSRDVAAGGKLRSHRAEALLCIHSSAQKVCSRAQDRGRLDSSSSITEVSLLPKCTHNKTCSIQFKVEKKKEEEFKISATFCGKNSAKCSQPIIVASFLLVTQVTSEQSFKKQTSRIPRLRPNCSCPPLYSVVFFVFGLDDERLRC